MRSRRVEFQWHFRWLVILAALTGSVDTLPGTVSTPMIRAEGPCVRVSFISDVAPEEFWLYYGPDDSPDDNFRTETFRATSTGTRNLLTCDLPPSSQVYLLIQSENAEFRCVASCDECDFGLGTTDAHCSKSGSPPFIVTDDFSDIDAPHLPQHSFAPNTLCAGPPDTRRTVSCNAAGEARDFMSLLRSAASDDTDLCHVIEIPAGCKIRETVVLPKRTGPGTGAGGIVVRTVADERLLPPLGSRIDPSFAPHLAAFLPPRGRSHVGRTSANAPYRAKDGVDGYRFERVMFAMPPPEDTFRQYRIEIDKQQEGRLYANLIDSNDVVTALDKPVLDIEDCVGLQGPKNALNPTPGRFRIDGSFTLDGPCENGVATFATAITIAEVHDTTPVSLTTVSDHGLPNAERVQISGIEPRPDNVTRISLTRAQHRPYGYGKRYIRSGDVVEVVASGTALDSRLALVTGSGDDWIDIAGDATCSSESCGSIAKLQTIQISHSGLECVDGARYFRKTGARSLELVETAACGSSQRGMIALDPAMTLEFIRLAKTSRIVLDQVLINCGGFPHRTSRCVSAPKASSIALLNSYVYNGVFWLPINVATGNWGPSLHDGLIATANTVQLEGSTDILIENNSFSSVHGIALFNDQFGPQARDWTIDRNHVYKPYRFLAGHEESDGRYYPDRHCFEVKSAERLLVQGLSCSGTWADWTPLGYAVILSPRGNSGVDAMTDTRHVRDVTMRGLYFERVGSGIQLTSETNSTKITDPTYRVSLSHSLFADIDYGMHRASPSGVGGAKPPNNFGGALITAFAPTAHIDIHNNTVGAQRGNGATMFYWSYHTASLWNVSRNVLSFVRNPVTYGLDARGPDVQFYPSCNGVSGTALWRCVVRRAAPSGAVSDPLSRASENVIVGSLENSQIASRSYWQTGAESTDDEVTVTAQEARSYFGDWGSGDHFFPEGPSWSDRLDATFGEGDGALTGWETKSQYAAAGADIGRLRGFLGLIGPVAVVATGANSVRIEYEGAHDGDLRQEECVLDYSTDREFGDGWWETGERVGDGGGHSLRRI